MADSDKDSVHSESCPNHPDNANGRYEEKLEQEVESFFEGPGFTLPDDKPTNWRECFDINNVEEQYRDSVVELLDKYPRAFSLHSMDLGNINVEELEISLEITQPPPRSKIYPIPPPLVEPTRKIVQELCAIGVLKPTLGTYQSACFLVPKNVKTRELMEEAKANGTFKHENFPWRFIVDFRPLNSVLVETFSGSTSISHIHSLLHKRKLAVCVDIASSFYQVRIKESSQHLLGIGLDAGLGHYTFSRLPMGLQVSPPSLSYISRYILNPKRILPNGECILEPLSTRIGVYVDDWVIVADTKEEMHDTMSKLLSRLSDLGYKISISKAEFYKNIEKIKIDLLGEECDSLGRTIASKKCELSEKYARPETKHQLQKLLGFYTFLSGHIQDFQTIVAPLTDRLSMQSGPLKWEPDMEKAYLSLKKAVVKNIKLYHQDFSEPLFLQCDSSGVAAGCALIQYIDNEVRIVNFHSTKYTKAIRERYSIVAKEALSICLALNKFRREMAASRQRAIITDSSAVVYILSGARAGNSRLSRLALTMQTTTPFRLVLKHRSGQDNILPDCLSRLFADEKPHLRLKNVNTMERDDLHLPNFNDGQIVSMEELNVFVNKNNDCVFPFLKEKSDISKVEQYNLVQEMNSIVDDIEIAIAGDNSMEGQILSNLFTPNLDKTNNIEIVSMAARDVTWENIIKAQRQDPTCLKHIREAERSHEMTNMYRIEHGMLVRKRYPQKAWTVPGNSLIVIPSTNGQLISNIIASLHFGHCGYRKILTVMRNMYYLSKAKKLVIEFVKGCGICSMMRLRAVRKDPFNHLAIATRPMQYLDVDFIYLPPYRKYSYVLSMIDRYSRKCFAVPTTNMSSKTVIKALEGIFSNHGVPTYVCGDNQVSLLRNAEVMNFCKKWGSNIRTGIPYLSKSQSIIETQNGALKYILKAMTIQHDTNDWPSLLGLCVYLLNTSPNTGLPAPLCPDYVHFGREVIIHPHMAHKVAGRVLPAEYYAETNNIHQANSKAIAAYHKWRFRQAPRDSQNSGTPFSPGKLVYFRRLQPQANLKPGTGIKYVNTIYRIEKVFHNLVTIRDVFKVTSPPYTVTTTVHFLKPFTPRDPFLFKHLKPDQQKLGGPLRPQDVPVGAEDNIIIPDIYNPNPPKPPPPPKPAPPKPKTETESEPDSSIVPDSSSPDSDDDATEADNHRPTPSMPNQEVKRQVPPNTPTPAARAEGKTGNRFATWLKEAISLPVRQTRSGRQLGT